MRNGFAIRKAGVVSRQFYLGIAVESDAGILIKRPIVLFRGRIFLDLSLGYPFSTLYRVYEALKDPCAILKVIKRHLKTPISCWQKGFKRATF